MNCKIYILNLFALTILSLSLMTANAEAVQQEVGASLTARQAISLTNVQNMSFGNITFSSNHNALIELGTDGHVNVNGTGLEVSGSTAAGSIDVSSDGVTNIEISCEDSGVLGSASGDALTLDKTEVSITPVAFGAGNQCLGLGNASLSFTGNTTILIGAEVKVENNVLNNGVYDTASNGGQAITVDIVYQ